MRVALAAGAIVGAVSLIFPFSKSPEARDCRSPEDASCICSCDLLEARVESAGRGTCIVSEAHQSFCMLNWNAQGGPAAAAAAEAAEEIHASPVIWPAPAVQEEPWLTVRDLQERYGASAEQSAVRHLNVTPPEASGDSELLAALSTLIHGHGTTTLAGFDVSPDSIGRFLEALWSNREKVLNGLRSEEPEQFQHGELTIVTSRGCIEFREGSRRLMIKAPFAAAERATCG